MDKELYEKAVTLQGEIKALEYELESTRDGSPNSGIEITVKTGYSDMGHDITRNMKLSGDMACDVWYLIRDVLKKRIHELEVEFEKL